MKKTLFVALIAVFVFAFAGSAFAAYGQSFTFPAVEPGDAVAIDPTFTKADADSASSNYYVEVRVTGPGAESSVVGVEGDYQWYSPVPSESGPGFVHYVSAQYVTWIGNSATLDGTAPTLTFNEAGTFEVEIRLCNDTGVYPAPAIDIIQTSTYNVTVGAPPVVSTPASSPWSLALLGVAALGAMAWFGRRTVISS